MTQPASASPISPWRLPLPISRRRHRLLHSPARLRLRWCSPRRSDSDGGCGSESSPPRLPTGRRRPGADRFRPRAEHPGALAQAAAHRARCRRRHCGDRRCPRRRHGRQRRRWIGRRRARGHVVTDHHRSCDHRSCDHCASDDCAGRRRLRRRRLLRRPRRLRSPRRRLARAIRRCRMDHPNRSSRCSTVPPSM